MGSALVAARPAMLAAARARLGRPACRRKRTLDVRRQIGLLLASTGRYGEASEALRELRHGVIAAYGNDSSEVAEVTTMLAPIDRYEG